MLRVADVVAAMVSRYLAGDDLAKRAMGILETTYWQRNPWRHSEPIVVDVTDWLRNYL